MEIGRKGCDASRRTFRQNCGPGEVNPLSRDILGATMGRYTVRRSPGSNKFLEDGKFAMVPSATKSRGRDFSKGGRFVTPWFSQLFLFAFFLVFVRWFGS